MKDRKLLCPPLVILGAVLAGACLPYKVVIMGVRIETEPPGAAITIDGDYAGDSPLKVSLKPKRCRAFGTIVRQ